MCGHKATQMHEPKSYASFGCTKFRFAYQQKKKSFLYGLSSMRGRPYGEFTEILNSNHHQSYYKIGISYLKYISLLRQHQRERSLHICDRTYLNNRFQCDDPMKWTVNIPSYLATSTSKSNKI